MTIPTLLQVDRLKRLLDAVHIEWVTGEQFEPRRIEDKVKARLRADIDFIIAVITKAGESKWIRDELADANARDLWVVVLLEDGATFDKGIFGTLEYITYDCDRPNFLCFQSAEGVFGNFLRDNVMIVSEFFVGHREIAAPFQQAVGDAGCSADRLAISATPPSSVSIFRMSAERLIMVESWSGK